MEVQWTTDPARGLQRIKIEDWPNIPNKGEPPFDRTHVYDNERKRIVGFTGRNVIIDETEGWIYQICLHGITMSGDHIAVESFDDHVRIIQWDDDLNDPETLFPSARIRRFYNYIVETTCQIENKGTVKFKGFKHEMDIYVPVDQIEIIERPFCTGGFGNVLDYATFVKPSNDITRHGIWMTNNLLDQHKMHRPSSWESWLG
jgi:hypothetical protein